MQNLLSTLAARSSDYDYLYTTTSTAAENALNSSTGAMIWTIIAIVLAVVGGILAHFLFTKRKKLDTENKFVLWLQKFLRFDTMCIEDLLKICYICLAIFLTLGSISCLISGSFWGFLIMLVGGNLLARVCFEFAMINIMIWRNTTDIKNVVTGPAKLVDKAKKAIAEKKAELEQK